jgi:hypothetical protein
MKTDGSLISKHYRYSVTIKGLFIAKLLLGAKKRTLISKHFFLKKELFLSTFFDKGD